MGPPAPDATPSTVHTEAAALRMGLAMGLIGVQDVVAWADRLIVENGAAGVPEAFELCTLDARQDAEAITLLREVGDAGDASALGVRCAPGSPTAWPRTRSPSRTPPASSSS